MKRLIIFLLFFPILIASFDAPFATATEDPYLAEPLPKDSWVDSLMDGMSLEQKIAQLIMVRANLNGTFLPQVLQEVSTLQVGGIVFFKGNPTEQSLITQQLQALSPIPLFVAIDGEWGLGMRIDSAWSFPKQMTLGALEDDQIIYEMGKEIARQCLAMGIHINFAPVVDINSNPNNPVINMRSFGENPVKVAAKGVAYMKGLQDHGVMAVAKHFPGHGNTDKDSHYTLPVVKLNRDEIHALMLPPFEALIEAGVDGIMTAHMEIPALEKKAKLPISLSEEGIHKLLQRRLGFRGLIFTDALEMKGVADYVAQGEVEVQAIIAGNDILLLPQDAGRAIASIKNAVEMGRISERTIDRRCRKVLLAKRAYQVDQLNPLLPPLVKASLASPVCTALSSRMYEQAITVVENPNSTLPLVAGTQFHATLAINAGDRSVFQKTLDLYGRFDHFNINTHTSSQERSDILGSLSDYPLVFVSIHGLNDWPQRNFGLDSNTLSLLSDLASKHQIILTLFGNPYAIGKLGNISSAHGLVVAYEDNNLSQQAAAQVIIGSIPAMGHLPVSTGPYAAGLGIIYPSRDILAHAHPIDLGINTLMLDKVDSIALQGITDGAYPGCQILAAKDGRIFYHKSFGYQDYEQSMPVSTGEMYDLASVTKIAATTLAMMYLKEKGLVDLDQTLGYYLAELKGSNKEKLIIREILAHQAGLKPWIPYHEELVKRAAVNPAIFSSLPSLEYMTRVSSGLYLRNDYQDSLWQEIVSSAVASRKSYKYSDLGMLLLQRLILTTSGKTMDQIVNQEFYQPMGLSHTSFNPGEVFCLNNVVPTEDDTAFRKMVLRGDVHDPTAALLGGVAGHAGLFSNAMDMGALMQMLVDGGMYGGKRYLNTETVQEFTRRHFPLGVNRRGLGFDKPDQGNASGPCCREASSQSFGHSGFTGTYAWADPDNGLVYIFLSNRTWPHGGENKLSRQNIRTKIHSVFYQAIREGESL